MSKFKELMDKKRKEGSKMEPMEAAARHSVLGGLVKSLDQDGLSKVKGLKKVTVAAPDSKHLAEGLDKAKEIVGEGESEVEGGDEHNDHLLKDELSESPEYDDEDSEEAEEDSPENHISDIQKHDAMNMHGEAPNHSEHPDNNLVNLQKENDLLRKEVAKLRAPKPFY